MLRASKVEQSHKSGAEVREFTVGLRELADKLDAIVEGWPGVPLLKLSGKVYVHAKRSDEFRELARRVGRARKGTFEDSFWIDCQLEADTDLKLFVFAPSREAVCTKRLVGYDEIPETKTTTVQTGKTVQVPRYEWDCGSIFADHDA